MLSGPAPAVTVPHRRGPEPTREDDLLDRVVDGIHRAGLALAGVRSDEAAAAIAVLDSVVRDINETVLRRQSHAVDAQR